MEHDGVRCAVIGAGLLGTAHIRFLAGQRPRARVVAVASRRLQVAQRAAEVAGATAYASYEEMLSREKLDLVVVATPDSFHREPTIAAIQAGVPNVCVQKPLATNSVDAAAIDEAARTAGARVFVWYENRGFGCFMATQYAIRSGLIGRVIYGDCTTDDTIGVPTDMWGERTKDWVGASSPASFLMTHTLDRLLWYMAPAKIARVFAMVQREVLGYTPDLFDAFLYFDNGTKMRAKSGWIHFIEGAVESIEQVNGDGGQIVNYPGSRFGVTAGWKVALKGTVPFGDLRHHQEVLRQRGIGSRLVWREPLKSGWNRGITCGLEIPREEAPNREILDFVLDAVIEGSDAPGSWKAWQGDGQLPMLDTAMHNVRVLEAINESAASCVPVDVKG